nr:reverse transcriptase domain-containing protein [Tanacetum cinerariifolium]
MSTQQDIYAAGSENRPSMLNKDNYVPWLPRIIRYARSRPNDKMIVDSIENGPYELTENDIKRMDADDQAIQTILLGLPKDVYAAVDSCETAKEIWNVESIESYYHHFMQLINDLKRNKHFLENIASNLKFLNNLQPEWKRYVTIVRQTKNLHEADFSQIYDFLKMNQDEDRQIHNVGGNGGNQFGQYAGQVAQNQQGYNAWQNGGIQVAQNANQNAGVQSGGNQNGLVVVPRVANQNGTGNVIAARAEEESDFMAAAGDLDEIEEVNANCILMANLQHASTSGTQLDKAPVYDTDNLAEVQLNDNCYDNEIFNMFTQEEQYTDLLEPNPEPQLVPQNDNHVTSVAPSMVHSGGIVKTTFASNEETRAHQETVYLNLVDQVAQVNMVNCNMRATNAELKSELARHQIQEQRVKISQEKYEKLKKCYQKSVYQEQCLTKKINALHLSFAKQITTLNDEISNLNKQLSKEKSYISSLMEEKKKLKHDFKIQEDKFLDKEVDLEAKIKDLENILLKRDQMVQTMHMLNPKPDLFYHPNQKMALAGDHRKVQINELNELRDQAYENSLIYKEKTKRLDDSNIKDHVFNIGDKVLLFNSRLNIFSGKLKSCWSGPFTISQVYPYGTVELSQPDGPNFKVNGHCLKHYFGEDVPRLIVLDLQTFPRDH